jgi:hypothetical protein
VCARVQPILNNPIYVTPHDLLKSLKMVVLGTSSALHTWDPVTEMFVGQGGLILIDGKNEIVSERRVYLYFMAVCDLILV